MRKSNPMNARSGGRESWLNIIGHRKQEGMTAMLGRISPAYVGQRWPSVPGFLAESSLWSLLPIVPLLLENTVFSLLLAYQFLLQTLLSGPLSHLFPLLGRTHSSLPSLDRLQVLFSSPSHLTRTPDLGFLLILPPLKPKAV